MKRVYDTREQVRSALATEGYQSGFSSPGRPELWVKGRSRMAYARQVSGADERWVILPYPEPSTCTPEQARELEKRDGIVLQAGQLVNEPDMTTTEPVIDNAEVEL